MRETSINIDLSKELEPVKQRLLYELLTNEYYQKQIKFSRQRKSYLSFNNQKTELLHQFPSLKEYDGTEIQLSHSIIRETVNNKQILTIIDFAKKSNNAPDFKLVNTQGDVIPENILGHIILDHQEKKAIIKPTHRLIKFDRKSFLFKLTRESDYASIFHAQIHVALIPQYQTRSKRYAKSISTPYYGRDLRVQTNALFDCDENQLLMAMTSFTKNIQYLNEQLKLIHCDVKPANLVLNQTFPNADPCHIYPIDFDSSNPINTLLKKPVGTVMRASPETYKGTYNATEKLDIYGTGKTFYLLFKLNRDKPLISNKQVKNLINKMFDIDPQQRPSWHSINSTLVDICRSNWQKQYGKDWQNEFKRRMTIFNYQNNLATDRLSAAIYLHKNFSLLNPQEEAQLRQATQSYMKQLFKELNNNDFIDTTLIEQLTTLLILTDQKKTIPTQDINRYHQRLEFNQQQSCYTNNLKSN